MPYLLGIDEAGYGPNLGPFVMSMAVVHVPESKQDCDLWKLLKSALRRVEGEKDDRLVVDDSKRVYTPGLGLAPLERSLSTFLAETLAERCPLERYWDSHTLTPLRQLQAEPWFENCVQLPCDPASAAPREVQLRLRKACQDKGVEFCEHRSVVVFPRQVNRLISKHDSKAAVPEWALTQLLQTAFGRSSSPSYEGGAGGGRGLLNSGTVVVDKLGGRNHYHPMLQTIFPDHFVISRCEGAGESSYRACGDAGDIEITFQPEADGRHLPVALASMLSKYVREVLMGMFNRFWQQHVPGIKPTAGYPGDSTRFYEEIREARERLGIADEVLWRVR